MSESIEENDKTVNLVSKIPLKSIAVGFLIWSIIGFSYASEFYLRNYHSDRIISFWDIIVGFIWEFSLYAVFTPFLLKFGKRFPLEYKISVKLFFRNILIHLIAGFIFSVTCFFLQFFIYGLTQGEICNNCFNPRFILNPHYLHRGVIVYWGIIMVGQGIEYFRRLNHETIRVAQLSSQLSEAQLSALKMQLQPHFLFNTLNSIVGLIQTDKDTAEIMTRKLSDFLRMTLKNSGEMSVTVEQEFHFIKTYLDIEKVRFQDRLSIQFSCNDDIRHAKVPNLILQPLVENSIKHGISPIKKGGNIKISAFREGVFLVLEVRDSGIWTDERPLTFESEKNGVGLKNTKARLKKIYGNDFLFTLEKGATQGTTATIKVPFEF